MISCRVNCAREKRIADEIVVDAYTSEKRALGLYCYLDEKLSFPFTARCIVPRAISAIGSSPLAPHPCGMALDFSRKSRRGLRCTTPGMEEVGRSRKPEPRDAPSADSPLKKGEAVTVVAMAHEDDCRAEMFVLMDHDGRRMGIPLAQLKTAKADRSTREAIEDWQYWFARGYLF